MLQEQAPPWTKGSGNAPYLEAMKEITRGAHNGGAGGTAVPSQQQQEQSENAEFKPGRAQSLEDQLAGRPTSAKVKSRSRARGRR